MSNFVFAHTDDEVVVINLDELLYLSYSNGRLYLHFKNGNDDLEGSLELMDQIVKSLKEKVV